MIFEFLIGAIVFLVGICVGYYRRPIASPLRKVSGSIPRWEVEAFASKVLSNLTSAVSSTEAKKKITEIGCTLHIESFPKEESKAKETWGVFNGGRFIRIQEGMFWRRRLVRALAHAVRLQLLGDADNTMKDKAWFSAAYRSLKKES